MTGEKKQLTGNEVALLLHIATLTTAIEDALKELDKIHFDINDDHLRYVLETALSEVWEDGGE